MQENHFVLNLHILENLLVLSVSLLLSARK